MVENLLPDVRVVSKKHPKSRLFCVVSKSKYPKAVKRNRIKRWCREVWRRIPESTRKDTAITITVHSAKITHKNITDAVEHWSNTASDLK